MDLLFDLESDQVYACLGCGADAQCSTVTSS